MSSAEIFAHSAKCKYVSCFVTLKVEIDKQDAFVLLMLILSFHPALSTFFFSFCE